MPDSPSLHTLATWLAGEFDNRAQAQEQPAWFVHLRLWYRPLPFRIGGNLALFAEQSNALYLDNPYRQRVAVLQELAPQQYQAQYFAFQQPDRVRGAGAHPDRLKNLTLDAMELLPGCRLTITQSDGLYKAHPEPEDKCYFQYEGQQRQVILGFEVSRDRLWSFDRGVDPETGQGLWGALLGAYEFEKQRDFSAELPTH